MLDMGFMPDIERMESHATMPRKGKRQTLMFSATFPDAIQRAASNFLDNYLFLKVGVVGSANSDITQSIFRCHKFEKRDTLLSIFKDLKNIEKTLIFVQQKKMTDFLASYLCQNEVSSQLTSICIGVRYRFNLINFLKILHNGDSICNML